MILIKLPSESKFVIIPVEKILFFNLLKILSASSKSFKELSVFFTNS